MRLNLINIRIIKLFFIILATFAYTDQAIATELYSFIDGVEGRDSELDKIVAMSYALVFFISVFLGLFMLYKGIMKMMSFSKNPNDPRNSVSSIIVLFVGASLLVNVHGIVNIMSSTLNGTSGYCSIYENVVNVDVGNGDQLMPTDGECFEANTSDLTEDLRASLEDDNEARKHLMHKINILFGILQTVGLAYFVKGIYTLKQISEGNNQTTYGQVILMLIMSSLVIDMPNTLEIIKTTIEQIRSMA